MKEDNKKEKIEEPKEEKEELEELEELEEEYRKLILQYKKIKYSKYL